MIKKYTNYYDIIYDGGTYAIPYEKSGIDESGLSHNYLNYKDNIFKPKDITICDKDYKLYLARFSNLYELYDYLKSEPRINKIVFDKLSSINSPESFAGKPYDEALEELISKTSEDFEEFLKIDSFNANEGISHKYEKYQTPTHGRLIIPSYCVGKPNCYESSRRIKEPKYINIHISLAYTARVEKSQVLNRALIITNILNALENAGYIINLDTFELSYLGNELAYIVVELKNYNDKLDLQTLYKTLCHIHFRRRILFRVLETLDLTNKMWGISYGTVCQKEFISNFLNFSEGDIYFDEPTKMGILGNDFITDLENAINYLNLQDKIPIEETKQAYKTKTKTLR